MGKIERMIHWSLLVLRFSLAMLFIYAGVVKAMNPTQFAVEIINFQLVPQKGAAFLALYLPYLEILCGGSLLWKKTEPAALIILGVLMMIFLGAILLAWGRGLDITCGCFGGQQKINYLQAVVRNVGLFLAIGILYVFSFGTISDRLRMSR